MFKIKIYLFILFFFTYNFINAQFDSTKWALKPVLDSIISTKKDAFYIFSNGKVGFINKDVFYIEPIYDKILNAENPSYYSLEVPDYESDYNDTKFEEFCLIVVKQEKYFGILKIFENSTTPLLMLPCMYDKVTISEMNEKEELLIEVKNGFKVGIFDAKNENWFYPLTDIRIKVPPKIGKPPKIKDNKFRNIEFVKDEEYYNSTTKPELNAEDARKDDNDFNEFMDPTDPSSNKTNQSIDKDLRINHLTPDTNKYFEYGNDFPKNLLKFHNFTSPKNYGIFNSKKNLIIIKAIYKKIEFSFNYFRCYLFNNEFYQIIDTLGVELSPVFKNIKSFNDKNNLELCMLRNGYYGIYNMKNYRIEAPFIYSDYKLNFSYVHFKRNSKWYIFDIQNNKFLNDSFDTIHTNSFNGISLVTQNKNLFSYNIKNNEKVKISKYKFVTSNNNYAILKKHNYQVIYNLNSNKFYDFKYDSILFSPNPDIYYSFMQHYIKKNKRELLFIVYKNGKIGLINIKNQIIVPIKFDLYNFKFEYSYNAIDPFPFLEFECDSLKTLFSIFNQRIVLENVKSVSLIPTRLFPNTETISWHENQYIKCYYIDNKCGLIIEPDSVLISPIFDSTYLKYNFLIFKVNSNKFYIFDIDKLPVTEDQYYDSLKKLDYYITIAYKNNLQYLFNFQGKLFRNIGIKSIDEINGNIFCYTNKNKKGLIIFNENYFSDAVFDDIKLVENKFLWAKQYGKWGILKF